MAKRVKAKWVGPYEAELPDKTVLVPHETVVELPAGEAEASENWALVGVKKSAKSEGGES